MYCRQEPDNPSIEDDSVTDNLLQETENLRRSSLSSMSKVDTKRKSTTMRRAILKQTVLDSSCVKVNGREDRRQDQIKNKNNYRYFTLLKYNCRFRFTRMTRQRQIVTLDPVSKLTRARRNPRGGPRQGENILQEKCNSHKMSSDS